MNFENRALLLLSAAALFACNDPPRGNVDAGATPDAPARVDTGSAPDAAASGDVAACQASVDAVRAACVAEDPASARLCLYDALRPVCATGRTAFVKAVFDCLAADACQSPSDAGLARSCVEAAIHAAATDGDRAAGAAVCACEAASPEPNCATSEPSYSLANLIMAPSSEVARFTTCMSSSPCAEQEACAEMVVTLVPEFACP